MVLNRIFSNTFYPLKMDYQTYDSLDRRIQALRIEVGDSDEASLVKQVAQIQVKLNKLYQENPDLGVLDQIRKNLPQHRSKLKNGITTEEKQELILLKHPQIKQAYQSLMELLSIEMPELLSEIANEIDTEKLLCRKQQLMELEENFHMIVVKNLVVIEKFVSMVESEMRFWNTTERRLNQLGTHLGAEQREWIMESKY